MGCCEGHSISPYLLSPRSAAAYHSILLKEKKPSKNKKVRFEISYTNFKELHVKEETFIPSYLSSLSNIDEWKEIKTTQNISIKYSEESNKMLTSATLTLNTPSGHESIICLVNNPKYRVLWDTDLRRMELLFGDRNLDATVGLLEKWEEKPRLYERNVRKWGQTYYISYTPFDENLKDNFIIFLIHSTDKLQIYWKEEIQTPLDLEIEKKFIWCKKFIEEIIEHKSV